MLNEAYRNGSAFIHANVRNYGVREALSLLRANVPKRTALPDQDHWRDYARGACDALIEAIQGRSI